MNLFRHFPLAGGLLCTLLLASTAVTAQQTRATVEAPRSIISLVPTPRPQGEILARHPGDSTFEHAPAQYHVFAAATVGQDAGVEVLTLNFAGETKLIRIESKNKDFVVEPSGTCHEGNRYGRGDTCSLLVRFNPQGPGHRLGFVSVAHTAEAEPMSFGLIGNGYSPVVSFTPAQITTVSSSATTAGEGTISGATNLAVDGGDVVYIADTGNNKLKEMDSAGNITATASNPIATPASLAADSFGIVYTANVHGGTYYFSVYYPWGSQTAYSYAYASSTCTVSAPCGFSAVGMNYPANMSIDNYNDLFFEEGTLGAAEMPVSSISGGSGAFSLWHLSDQFSYSSGSPASFASDASGNIYTKYSFSTTTCYLVEESLYSAEYSPTATRVAGGTRCGFSGDGGQARSAEISSTIGQIAFDVAGNLYFADAGNQRIRRIDALTGIINTIAGNGAAGFNGNGGAATNASLSNPTGLAVDSQGQVYVLTNAPTAGPTQALRRIGPNGFWAFSSQVKGTVSAAKVFTVANTGNDTLTLSSAPVFTGTNPADFAIDPNTTSCVLTAGATLVSRHSCKIGVVFKPTAGGVRTANLLLLDNTVNNSNVINLTGNGLLAPTMSITAPTAGSSVSKGATVTFAVKVTSSSSPIPTGTVTFKVSGVTIGSPVTLSGTGTASTSFAPAATGTGTLSAVYSGDANYATATASESLIVTAVKASVSVGLAPAARPAWACGGLSFSVDVSSTAGGSPSGTVELKSGVNSLASAKLSNGGAILIAKALPPGLHMFIASYSGDTVHEPAASAPVSLIVPLLGSTCTVGHLPPATGMN
jgi:hypothetical protein